MIRGIVLVAVDSHHDGDVLALRGGRDDHLFRPGIDVLARVGRLYEAWNEAAPDPARSAQATEWKQKLADFDKHTTNLKPGGPEP